MADIADFGWDLLGIFGFLALAFCMDPIARGRSPAIAGVALSIAGALAVAASLLPPAQKVRILIARAHAIPQIIGFDKSWESGIYWPVGETRIARMPPPDDWPIQGGRVMEVTLAPIEYSGIIIEPVSDWTGFSAISFIAATDSTSIDMVIRIHDDRHINAYSDRFNRTITLGPTPERYSILLSDVMSAPETRALDLSSIDELSLFVHKPKSGERIIIDDIRLEND